MSTEYHLLGIHASTIAYMEMKHPGNAKAPADFGPWLRSKIDAQGMTQGEFAKAIRVSPTSVSRWIRHGDRPKAEHLEPISDVLVVDYDLLATRAGYRPRELSLEVDPTSAEGQLVPIIRKIEWDDRDIKMIRLQLEQLAKDHPKREDQDE